MKLTVPHYIIIILTLYIEKLEPAIAQAFPNIAAGLSVSEQLAVLLVGVLGVFSVSASQGANARAVLLAPPQPAPTVSRTATTLSAEDFPPKERPTNPDGKKT